MGVPLILLENSGSKSGQELEEGWIIEKGRMGREGVHLLQKM